MGVMNRLFKYIQKKKTYRVIWIVDNVQTLTENYKFGELPTYKLNIEEKNMGQRIKKVFAGWTPSIEKVKNNVVYHAEFMYQDRLYKIKWNIKNDIVTQELKYGDKPAFNGIIPKIKLIDETYEEKFIGWDAKPKEVTSDRDYNAIFHIKKRKYTITFIVNDKTINREYVYDATPKEPVVTNDRNSECYIEFIGWDKNIRKVDGDETYTAKFKKSPIKNHAVVFYGLKNEVVDIQVVKHNTAIESLPKLPSFYESKFKYESTLFYLNSSIGVDGVYRNYSTASIKLAEPNYLLWDYNGEKITEDRIIQLIPNTFYDRPILYLDKIGKVISSSFPILYFFLPLPPEEYKNSFWMIDFQNDFILFRETLENDIEEHDWWRVINFEKSAPKVVNEFNMKLVGVTFNDRQNVIQNLRYNEELFCKRQANNKYDPNAVLIINNSGEEVGYISKEQNGEIAEKIDSGIKFRLKVQKRTGSTRENFGIEVNFKELEKTNVRHSFEKYRNIFNKYKSNEITEQELLPYLESIIFNKQIEKSENTIYGFQNYMLQLVLSKNYKDHMDSSRYLEDFKELQRRAIELGFVNNYSFNDTKVIELRKENPPITTFNMKASGTVNLKIGDHIILKAQYQKRVDENYGLIEVYDNEQRLIKIVKNHIVGNLLLLGFNYKAVYSGLSSNQYAIGMDGLEEVYDIRTQSIAKTTHECHFSVSFSFPFEIRFNGYSEYKFQEHKLKYSKIEFETNGGSKVDDIYYRDIFNCKEPLPYKNGFEFNGWYYDEKLDIKADWEYLNYKLKSMDNKSLKLYAKWKNETFSNYNKMFRYDRYDDNEY